MLLTIRHVQGKEAVATVPVEGPVTSLLVCNLAGPGFASKNFIFYGTQNGYVGLLLVRTHTHPTAVICMHGVAMYVLHSVHCAYVFVCF